MTSTSNLTVNTTYNINVIVTDVNGDGLSSSISIITFTVGAQRVNLALCEGWQGAPPNANCEKPLQVQFLTSATRSPVSLGTLSGGGSSITYPSIVLADTYNVLLKNPDSGGFPPVVDNTTGALEQGTLYIQAEFSNINGQVGSDYRVYYTIQVNPTAGGGWQQAADTTTTPSTTIWNVQLDVANDATATGTLHNFTTPGEYRVVTTKVTGETCGTGSAGTTSLIFNFGDENVRNGTYTGCTGAPE